jgi:Ca2+-binding RTX toxin-like protein
MNGTNELTAKISCFNSMNNQTINKWSSINVTGTIPNPIDDESITSSKLPLSSRTNVTSKLTSESLMNDNSEILLSNNISRVRVDGTESNDNISGIAEHSIIKGNGGNDIIKAGNGSDLIQGGRGNDKIYGERGNDILFGGSGDDVLTGGKGADIYYCGEGQDLVTDYNSTEGDMRSSDCETVN